MNSVEPVVRIVDKINELAGRIGSFLFLPLIFAITFEIVMRYVFNSPTIWVHETSEYLLVVMAMLGGGYTFLHKGHVSVDIIYARLSTRGKAILDLIITAPFMLILYYVLVWKGAAFAWQAIGYMEKSGTFWNPPIYVIKSFLPIGGFLLMIQGLAKIVRDFTTVFKKVKLA